jgi:hypothetical protein
MYPYKWNVNKWGLGLFPLLPNSVVHEKVHCKLCYNPMTLINDQFVYLFFPQCLISTGSRYRLLPAKEKMTVGCIREKVNKSGCVSTEDCLEFQRCTQNSPIRRMCAMFSSSFDSISCHIKKQTLRLRYTVHRTERRDPKHLKLSNEHRYDV